MIERCRTDANAHVGVGSEWRYRQIGPVLEPLKAAVGGDGKASHAPNITRRPIRNAHRSVALYCSAMSTASWASKNTIGAAFKHVPASRS